MAAERLERQGAARPSKAISDKCLRAHSRECNGYDPRAAVRTESIKLQSEQIACVYAFLSGEQEATSVKLRIVDQLQVFQERRSC